MASIDDYMNALIAAIKGRDKSTTKILLRPYIERGGKVEDLFNLRRKK